MGVGLWLHGTCATADNDFLARLRKWFENDLTSDPAWCDLPVRCQVGTSHEGQPTLYVHLHLAAEDAEVRTPEPGRVLVSAKTSTVGPGYHTALCQILRHMGEANGITWTPENEEDEDSSRDETGYFFGGPRAAVEHEMLQHLRTMAAIVGETLGQGFGGLALGMPMSHTYAGGPIKTPVGVRDLAWLERVREDPRNGSDLFPWWDDGVGAGYLLGRAICELAMNVRWRPAEYDTEHHDALEEVHADLSRAFRLDPTLAYPWREWAEMLDYMEWIPEEDEDVCAEVRRRAATVPAEQPLIGYRRHPVELSLVGGWRITIPGMMDENWEEGRWSAWDGRRTIWFSCWTFGLPDGSRPDAATLLDRANLTAEGEALTHEDGPLVGRAVLGPYEEDGQAMWNLKAFSAVPGNLALCNLYFPDESYREWAIAQWHALLHSGTAGGQG